jgi:hypothetical protein
MIHKRTPGVITSLDDPAWQALFTGLRASWFRLETLQSYDVHYEADEYRAFLKTGRLDRRAGDWQHMIAAHRRAGRSLQRVHVVVEPLTDYLRYELAAYAHNSRAGEEIRILATPAGEWPAGVPQGQDFWLFDDADAWVMAYDPAGRFVAAEQLTDADEIRRCLHSRDCAIRQSMPLEDYSRRSARSPQQRQS